MRLDPENSSYCNGHNTGHSNDHGNDHGNDHSNGHSNGHGNGNRKGYNKGYRNSYGNDYKRFWWFARNLNIVLGLDSTSKLAASLEPLRTETDVKTRGRAGCESGD